MESTRRLARHNLELVADPTDFVYALQNVAVFEDLGVGQRELEDLANQETRGLIVRVGTP